MLLSVKNIMASPGGSIPFETALDLHDMTFGGCCPVSEPVRCSGKVRNTAGVLELTGELHTILHGVCDRCSAPFDRAFSCAVSAVLVEDDENDDFENPWTFSLQDGHADLDDILTTAFVLNMDSKLLCREDCRGYCFKCGANLNTGSCTCKPETDPRLAVLQKLLNK